MLELVNISKTYRLKNTLPVRALDQVNVTFQEKGMVFILGKSGSGKSTMMNIIGGLDKADKGEIIIQGRSSKYFKEGDFDSYRNTFIGFVFQEYNLLEDFTIGKNIALALELQGRVATKEAINDILTQVDMQGYEHRRVNQISGGQKQRVAIARALIKSPQIILADEPTGALDSVTGHQVFDILQKLSRDKLVIVVSHDRETAEVYGDRIIEMKDGKVLSDTSKILVPPTQINEGLKVNQNIVHIANNYHFTPSDLTLIDQMKAEHETVILTKNEALVTSYSFDHTDASKLETKKYDGNLLKLIVSKLKNIDSLKIGASGLKHKRVRLFFTILLSFVSISFFALTDTMTAFQSDDAHARTLANNHIKQVQISQIYKDNKDNNIFGDMYSSINFSQQSIDDIKKSFPNAGVAPIMNADYNLNYHYDTIASLSPGNSYLYTKTFGVQKQTVFINQDYIDINDIELLAGNYPSNQDDYMISSFALEVFHRLSFPYYLENDQTIHYLLPSDFTTNEATNASLVIGKNIKANRQGKISGVYKVKYDQTLFSEDGLKEASRQERDPIVPYIDNHYLFALYQDEAIFDNLALSTPGISDRYYPAHANLLIDEYEAYKYYQQLTYNIEEAHLIDDLVVRFDNQALKSNQIILSYHLFLYSYQTPVFSFDSFDANGNPKLSFIAEGNTYTFNTVNDLMSWTKQASNIAIFKNLFKENYQTIKINNPNKGTQNIEEYELGGIYFPTTEYINDVTGTTYYFSDRYDSTFTVSSQKQIDFPLSVVTRLLFTNNSNDLYSTYRSLIHHKVGSYNLSFNSEFTTFFLSFGSLIQAFSSVFLVLGIILAVFSALLMMNFIATSISYKKRDIGILRGLGARKLDVIKIFTYESLVIATINIVLATIVVIPGVALINNVAIKELAVNVTLLAFTFRQFLLIIGVAILSALVASILPVLKTARKKPIDAINNR